MCSFLVTNLLFFNLTYVNWFARFRGPDATNVVQGPGNYTFVHNLLWQTGPRTLQPFIGGAGGAVSIRAEDGTATATGSSRSGEITATTGSQSEIKSSASGLTPLLPGVRSIEHEATSDGRTFVLFNGEIYNFPELILKYDLFPKGNHDGGASSGGRRKNKNAAASQSATKNDAPPSTTSGGRGGDLPDFDFSDGEILLPLYRKLGPLFAQELEGEFAIAIYDFAKRQVVLSRDTFGTKPLYYWRQKRPSPSTPGFHVASYRSTLCRLKAAAAQASGSAGAGDESSGEEGENLSVDQIEQTCSDRGFDDGDDVKRFPPNTVAVFPLVDEHEDEQDDLGAGVHRGQYTRIWTRSLYEFDARQFKNHTRDWHAAFDRSMHMRLRFTQHPLFIALSSGFDSGLLHAAYVANAVGSAAHREDSLSARRLRPLAFRRSPRGKQILHTFSIRGKEELNTLRGRVRYSKKLGEIIDRRLAERSQGDEIIETSMRIVDGGRHEKAVLFHFGTQTAAEQISKLKTYCEPYRFRWHGYPQDGPYTQGAFIWADQATHGLSVVYSAARRHGARIALSGTGGDEHVAGDYSRFGPDSYSEVPELPSDAEVEEWETNYNSISAAASPEVDENSGSGKSTPRARRFLTAARTFEIVGRIEDVEEQLGSISGPPDEQDEARTRSSAQLVDAPGPAEVDVYAPPLPPRAPWQAKTLAVEFPWGGFFLDRLQDYIMKEEVVAGAYGIETRFPFLDRRLVQEFLWLSADVKNSKYKRPIVDYLLRNWYPFVGGRKMGFGVRPWDKKEFEKGNRHWVEDMVAGAGGGAGG